MNLLNFTITSLEPVVAFSIGPVHVHWYGLAYLTAFLVGWWLAVRLGAQSPRHLGRKVFDDLLPWMLGGVILGGRLGYVFFYNWERFSQNPIEILYTWEGGMAFHGGLFGCIMAILIYARRNKLSFLMLTDVMALVTPIGLFLGRIANFVNGELYGRLTDQPWGVVFRSGGPYPRHPSQLYEAALEGLVLFAVLNLMNRRESIRARLGMIGASFMMGYGLCRFSVEFFREPDIQIGYIMTYFTKGQLLSLPVIGVGAIVYYYVQRQKA